MASVLSRHFESIIAILKLDLDIYCNASIFAFNWIMLSNFKAPQEA